MVDRASGRSRCFGFITMQDPQTLDTILGQIQVLDGKKVDCKRAVPREQGQNSGTSANPYFKTKKMFVGGLPPDVTNESCRLFFEQFGDVEDSVVILDKETGRPRGFGFITFVSEDTADRVLENFEKNCINGKWVECKKATPRQAQGGYQNYSVPFVMYPNVPQPYFYNDYYQRPEYYGQGFNAYPSAEFTYLNAYTQNNNDIPHADNQE